MWVYPERFSQFVPRLGGMYMWMNFIGCVETLIAESGLDDVMNIIARWKNVSTAF